MTWREDARDENLHESGMGQAIRINRAPVLTLWASIVAERLGWPHETALTMGQTVAGMTALIGGQNQKCSFAGTIGGIAGDHNLP